MNPHKELCDLAVRPTLVISSCVCHLHTLALLLKEIAFNPVFGLLRVGSFPNNGHANLLIVGIPEFIPSHLFPLYGFNIQLMNQEAVLD